MMSDTAENPKVKRDEAFKLSRYSREKVIKMLSLRETSLECDDIRKLMTETKIPLPKEDKFIEFMNAECKKGEKNVETDMDGCEPFVSLNQWTKLVRDGSTNENNGTELALLMRLIAFTEEHPDSRNSGVDFKSLYLYLADLMMGRPVADLNNRTKFFLEEIFDEILTDLKKYSKKRILKNIQSDVQQSALWENGIAQENSKLSENPLIFSKSMNPLELREESVLKLNNINKSQ